MKSLAIKAHMLMIQKRAELQGDRGATAVEYGLLVALIAVVIIVAVVFLGTQPAQTPSTPSRRPSDPNVATTPHGVVSTMANSPPWFSR